MAPAPRNPYIAGKALKDARGFWGRDDVFRVVQAELEQTERNAIVLFGQRRIGKTSILLNLQSRLPSPPFQAVYFDLMDRARKPLAEVLFELASTIASDLGLQLPNHADFLEDAPHYFRKQFLPEVYQKLGPNQRLVLLFDEFDVLDVRQEGQLSNQSATQAFFPYLRELMVNESQLGFVFVVGRKAGELSIEAKAAFKAARYYRISVLDADAAQALVRSAELDGALQFEAAAVQRILSLTSNHPYFTQLLCQLIFEREYAIRSAATASSTVHLNLNVTISDVESAVPKVIEAGENIFEWIWDGLPPAERVIFSAVAAGTDEQSVVSEDRLLGILQASGVRILVRELELAPKTLIEWEMLREAEGGYRFFVELMRRWVVARKPLAKVKDELDKINPLADTLYQAANGFVRRGDWNKAEDQLKQALGVNSNHLKARLLLAETYKTLKRPDDQLRELAEAYRIDEDGCRIIYETALLECAEALGRDSQNNIALQLYARVLEISPQNRTAKERRRGLLLARGEAALKANELEIARLAFVEAEAADWTKEVEARIQQRDAEVIRVTAETEARATQRRMWIERVGMSLTLVASIAIAIWIVIGQLNSVASPVATLTPTTVNSSNAAPPTAQVIQVTAPPTTQFVVITAVVPLNEFLGERATYRVAFSPDGKTLAMGGISGQILLQDISNPVGQVLAGQLDGNGSVLALAYSPNGKLLAVGNDKGVIKLWDVTGKVPSQIGPALEKHTDRVNCLTFSADSKLLLSASYDGNLRVWNVADPSRENVYQYYEGHKPHAASAVFHPDGKLVISGGWDNLIRVWDTATGRLLGQPISGHENWITSLAISADGKLLVSGSNDDTVRLWDFTDPIQPKPIGAPIKTQFGTVESVSLSPDAQTLATAHNNGAVIFWDITNRQQPQLLGAAAQGHTGTAWQVAFSPDGTLLASAGDDGLAKLWQVPVQRPVSQNNAAQQNKNSVAPVTLTERYVLSNTAQVDGISINIAGKLLAVGTDRGAQVYQLSDGQRISDINPTGSSLAVAYSPDGAHLAVADSSDVAIFHASDGALATKLRGHSDLVQSLAWDPGKSTRLASSSADRSIRIWDIATGQTVVTITEALRGYATALSFSPDGQYLAAASGYENDAGIWKVEDGSLVRRINGDSPAIAYHPNNKWLALGGTAGVKLIEAETQKPIAQAGSKQVPHYITTVVWDAEGRYLAAAWSDNQDSGGSVQLWWADADGALILLSEVKSGTGAIRQLTFSSDGKWLAATSAHGGAIVWEMTTP